MRGAAAALCPRSLLPFSPGSPLSHLRRGVGGPRRPGIPGAGCPSLEVPPSSLLGEHCQPAKVPL